MTDAEIIRDLAVKLDACAEDRMFLIEKRGLYYRPNSRGYTGLKAEAGRYSFEDAAIHAGPNGPNGSTDFMGIWQEDEAPIYSTKCPWDVRMKDQAYQDGIAAGRAEHVNELTDALDRVAELEGAIKNALQHLNSDGIEDLRLPHAKRMMALAQNHLKATT